MFGRWRGTFVILLVTLEGCARTPELEYPQIPVASRKIAAFPTEGVEWEYDFYGAKVLDEEGVVIAKKHVDDSINYRVRRHGGRAFQAASLTGLEHASEFRRWAADTLSEIITERLGGGRERHAGVEEFRFAPSIAEWRAPLGADFVLISMFLDGHNTDGRALAVGIAGGWLAARRAISCAVHLRSGRIVWCNLNEAMTASLMHRSGAQREVDELLEDMLRAGDAVPVEPAPSPGTLAPLTPAEDVAPAPPYRRPRPGTPDPNAPAPLHFKSSPQPAAWPQ